MGLSIAVISQKGGVGKTTLAANLAYAFSELEFKTLLVEVDPQGSLLQIFGLDRFDLQHGLLRAIRGEESGSQSVERDLAPSLDLLAANVWSHEEELQYLEAMRREPMILQVVLEQIRENYDYIVLDCPPALGPVSRSGLAASDRYLVPVQAEGLNLATLPRLEHLADLVRRAHNPELTLDGYVITMADARTRHANQVMRRMAALYAGQVLKTVIPRSIRVAEESTKGRPTLAGGARTRVGDAFRDLAEEILTNHARARGESSADTPPPLSLVSGGI